MTSQMSSRATHETRPASGSPAGPRSTPSSPTMPGRKSTYSDDRKNVWSTPVERMCTSVAKWSRTNVNVASGEALTNDV